MSRISFTNTKYELDKPAPNRHQYVLIEAAVQSQLVGGRLAMQSERRDLLAQQIEKGLRIRLNPQGITGTSYLEIDFVDDKANPLLSVEWEPEFLYVPSARSTVTQFVDAASDFVAVLRKIDLEKAVANVNQLLSTANARNEQLPIDRIDRQSAEANTFVSELRNTNRQLNQQLARLPLDRFDKLGADASALVTELRESTRQFTAVLANPDWGKVPTETVAAFNSAQRVFDNKDLTQSIQRMQRAVARLERLLSSRDSDFGVTLENLRELTDNLRDVSETARRYPSSLILGEPPPPAPALARPSK